MPQGKKCFKLESSTACVFCGKDENNEFLYGKFFHTKSVSVHQNCLFFASGLGQHGRSESHGILGFLISDIEKEIQRGKKLKCFHCKKSGATVGCCKAVCRRTFHYPCGIKNHTLHQFFDKFSSYCELHRPRQKAIETPEDEFHCRICYSPFSKKEAKDCLYTSCCNHYWYHHTCLQNYALSAGRHFFKCPFCNNSADFISEVEFYGICIPEKDASWELEENAYQDLLYRPGCGADNCDCPNGRKYNGKSSWNLLFCSCCGSVARHRCCANLKNNETTWECEECKLLEDQILKKKVNPESTTEKTKCSKQDLSAEDTQILQISLSVSEPSCSYVSSNSAISTFIHNTSVKENAGLQQSVVSQCEIKVTSAENCIKIKTEETSNGKLFKRKVQQELNSNCKKICTIDSLLNEIKEENSLNNPSLVLPFNSVKMNNLVLKSKINVKKRKTGKKFNEECCSGSSSQCIKRMFGMECQNYRI